MIMETFVLDTNIFFNMEAGLRLGKTTFEVIENLSSLIKKGKKQQSLDFYMTPKVVDEFLSFFEDKDKEKAKNFLSLIKIESPDVNNLNFSAAVFQKLVEDVRARSYRGLNIAEEEIEAAAKMFMNEKNLNIKDFQIKVGDFIRRFRERYRKATREGFLDSLADFEIIALAKQKDAFLVSTDQGVINWGRLFAVKETPALIFAKHLEFVLQHHQE
ncbi:MAG: hypothetical protein Fur009_0300 [Candidatus Microgenomates bacterium]